MASRVQGDRDVMSETELKPNRDLSRVACCFSAARALEITCYFGVNKHRYSSSLTQSDSTEMMILFFFLHFHSKRIGYELVYCALLTCGIELLLDPLGNPRFAKASEGSYE